MTDPKNHINQLLNRLELLRKQQDEFSKEINNLGAEIHRLKDREFQTDSISTTDLSTSGGVQKVIGHSQQAPTLAPKPLAEQIAIPPKEIKKPSKGKSDFEKFIGENLINKIGIAITVIGVAIGAKYSIENDLISPLTRIILGYLAGMGLLGFGIKLKTKYENYSAVLVSGAMAILYFITFAAYDFYALFPQGMAFALMVIFTAFTVVAAINYNKQLIALIGLVGAYAVPFLLSNGSGQLMVLFGYMGIINIGVLIIALKKYWKPLYYSAFGLTWAIFLFWYLLKYKTTEHFGIGLTFLCLFFAIFYAIFLGYKLLQKEKIGITDLILLLLNSFIFYGIGYAILSDHETGNQLLGLFTLGNALIHFVVGVVIYNKKLADANLFYVVIGLVLVFITIAVPVQLNGNWVTLLWAGEAALLFWVGRAKKVPIYEKLSFPLMLLAVFSIFEDWTWVYNGYDPEISGTRITPLLNINFLTSILCIAAFGFMFHIRLKYAHFSNLNGKDILIRTTSRSIPVFLIVIAYFALRMELTTYWDQIYLDSAITITPEGQEYANYSWNYDIRNFGNLWAINYTLLFVTILSFINIKKVKSHRLGIINITLNVLVVAFFLFVGLYQLSELRDSYQARTTNEFYQIGAFNIGMRYVSYVFVAMALWACHMYSKQGFLKLRLKMGFDLLLCLSVLWIGSSELINWMDLSGFTQSYKLGLSIFWGIFALILIGLGIWKGKKHLRIVAFVLFGITLIKLFFYDISHMDTIAKTIVFVTLGILLLIISFLYNKYKHIISNETEH